MKYPLSPVPPFVCQYNGDMHKTDKSKLEKILKSKISQSQSPVDINVDVIDGFHFLHLLSKNLPQIFDRVSQYILKKICNTPASEIHLVFDRYFPFWIKDCEREHRNEEDYAYSITGPAQTRPIDFATSLGNIKFKGDSGLNIK